MSGADTDSDANSQPQQQQPPATPDTETDNDSHSMLGKLIALIKKDPNQRPDFECQGHISFLKKYIEWFNVLQPEMVHEIIKKCRYLRMAPGTVFIKQGDTGDIMYGILRGQVSVHILSESETDKDILSRVEAALEKPKLIKADLGIEVTQKKMGSCIGEVALVNENCTRTATCMTTAPCDFLVLDRTLYNVSVREFVEKEFRDKTDFVARNPLFKHWTNRQRGQLIFSLKKMKVGFGERLTRQGQDLDGIYFIYKGDLEIHIDSKQYEKQYPILYNEMKTLLPDLVAKPQPAGQPPHVTRKDRMASHKSQTLCLLGANETVGSVEVILGLDSYIETVVSPGDCELFVFRRAQFEKAFKRKYAAATLQKLKESLADKLCLYIHQLEPKDNAFLKFLNIKLMDPEGLSEIKKSKEGRTRRGSFGVEKLTKTPERQDMLNLRKKLHMSTESAAEMPPEDMTVLTLTKLERRLREWSVTTHMNGGGMTDRRGSASSQK